MTASLQPVTTDTIDVLLSLVADYHAFEQLGTTAAERRRSIALLMENEHLGSPFLIVEDKQTVGYIVLCFGFSIEFGGIDAFVDEFYLIPAARGRGVGAVVLEEAKRKATERGVVALHLEVAKGNERARRLYVRHGFAPRDHYTMMSCPLSG